MTFRAHLLVMLVTLANLVFVLSLVRRRRLQAKYSLLWVSVGLAFVVLAASPSLLDTISDWVGIYYAPATLFLGGFVFLLFVVVHFSWELSRLEERTRVLAEEAALLRSELEVQRKAGHDVDLRAELSSPPSSAVPRPD